MPCAPVWSWPRACASRGIENLLRALDVGGDETVLDGGDHDEIYLDGQNRAELIEEAEVSIHEIVRMHGAELDEQVQVALSGPKVVAKGGAEDVEACHPETRACLSDSRALVSGYIDHVAPPWTMVPRATTDQRVARQPQGAAARFTARAYLPRRPVCWTRRLGGRPSVGDEELLHRHADISGDLAKQCRGDVTTRMKRDRRDPAIRVAELLVRAAAHHTGISQNSVVISRRGETWRPGRGVLLSMVGDAGFEPATPCL